MDLDSEDERVRNEVLSCLYSRDVKLELPWEALPQKARTQHKITNITSQTNPNLNNFNFSQNTQYPGKGEPYPLNHVYKEKNIPQQQTPVFVNSSNHQITKNDPYTSLTVQQTNAAIANVKPLSGNIDIQTTDTKQLTAANQVTVNGTVCQPESQLTNGVEVAPAAPVNKSWASLFNKPSTNTAVSVAINGCDKQHQNSTAAVVEEEEIDDEFSQMKKALKAKYDDPNFYRMGGE